MSKSKKPRTFVPVKKTVPVKEPVAKKAKPEYTPERIARMSRFQKEALGVK